MSSNIGPLDGRRARRRRCDACVRRKRKCHGGFPCENCRRTNRVCTTPVRPATFTPVYVGESLEHESRIKPNVCPKLNGALVPLLQLPSLPRAETSFTYFFASFLPMNAFTSSRMAFEADLSALMHTSPGLVDAVHAVATLHRTQKSLASIVGSLKSCESAEALQAYSRSVCYVHKHIESKEFLDDPSALWTTFLLGLFELMREPSGDNWLSHFLHGTCTILRLQHPSTLCKAGFVGAQKRSFFLATRIFEIARSLIYSSPSFLSQPEWVDAMAQLWEGECQSLWHPKEALFDLLPQISDLSIRAIGFCASASRMMTAERQAQVQALSDEGLILQNALLEWQASAKTWETAPLVQDDLLVDFQIQDTGLITAYLYYHAISIYLSGTYDYHIHWNQPGAPSSPILSRPQIEDHVAKILSLSQEMLERGLAGVLLFFPLRVAGARARRVREREHIVELLRETMRRGFVVAGTFEADLRGLWRG